MRLCTRMPLVFAPHHYRPGQLATLPIPTLSLQTPIFIHFSSKFRPTPCYCSSNDDHHQFLQGFSALDSEPPWESGSVWTNMALYFFSLHVPMSFGGLSVVAHLLNQPHLEPQTKAVAILVIETLELFGALLFLQFTASPEYRRAGWSVFKFDNIRGGRNWVLTALLGFVVLAAAIFVTSLLADRLSGSEEAMNNQVLKDILLSSSMSQAACTLVYCVVAPLLEEIIYRGFLLKSLASTMQWPQAVVTGQLSNCSALVGEGKQSGIHVALYASQIPKVTEKGVQN